MPALSTGAYVGPLRTLTKVGVCVGKPIMGPQCVWFWSIEPEKRQVCLESLKRLHSVCVGHQPVRGK